jgi:hypothetical protein
MSAVMRHLLNVVAALSLVLCVAAPTMWFRSYRVADRIIRYETFRTTVMACSRGQLSLICHSFPASHPSRVRPGTDFGHGAPTEIVLPAFTSGARREWRLFRFVWLERDGGTISSTIGTTAYPAEWIVAIPLYAITIFFLLAAALWLWRRVRQIAPPGRCAVCGYDLRATPDRCPECGKVGHHTACRPP